MTVSNITASTSVEQVKEEELGRFVDLALQDIVRVVNGNLDFETNFNCQLIDLSFSLANTEQAFGHSLKRVPKGYILTRSDSLGTRPFDTSTPFNANVIYLQATAAGDCSILLF